MLRSIFLMSRTDVFVATNQVSTRNRASGDFDKLQSFEAKLTVVNLLKRLYYNQSLRLGAFFFIDIVFWWQ